MAWVTILFAEKYPVGVTMSHDHGHNNDIPVSYTAIQIPQTKQIPTQCITKRSVRHGRTYEGKDYVLIPQATHRQAVGMITAVPVCASSTEADTLRVRTIY